MMYVHNGMVLRIYRTAFTYCAGRRIVRPGSVFTAHFPVEPSRHPAVMKTGRLLGIIAILGLMTTACTADHGNGSPSVIHNDQPSGQSQVQSGTQSPPAEGTPAAIPDANRPAPAQGSHDGVYGGTAVPVNTGGGVCTRTERISDFRVKGNSVRWRSFRGRIANNRLRMVHGNTWITGQFAGGRFNGQVIQSHRSGTGQCTFVMTLERAGA